MTIVAAASPHPGGHGGRGVLSAATTQSLIPSRNRNGPELIVSSIPIPSSPPSPCPISSYIQLSDRHIDVVNESSTAVRLISTVDSQNSDDDESSFSCFDVVRALCLPLLWQSFCAGLEIVRYVLLGQLIEQDGKLSEAAIRVSSPTSWLSLVESPAAASCLTCLALLACVAMAVHPDGLTWIALRKLRELLMSILHSSTTCWAWLLNDDTGVISTILALTTFCALFFFCYVLHRTLAPKQPRRLIKTEPPTAHSASTAASSPNVSSPGGTASKKKKKKKHAAKRRNVIPATSTTNEASRPRRDQSPVPVQQFAQTKEPKLCPFSATKNSIESILPGSISSRTSTETTLSNDSGMLIGSAVAIPKSAPTETEKPQLCEEKPPRLRVSSGSTAETVTSSVASSVQEDEISASSLPSQNQPKQKNHHHNRSKRATNSRGGRPGYNSNNYYHNNSISSPQNTNELVVSRRWDALKPETQQASSRTNRLPYSSNSHKQSSGAGNIATSLGQQSHRGNAHGGYSSTPLRYSNGNSTQSTPRKELSPEVARSQNTGETIECSPDVRQMQALLPPVENGYASRYYIQFASPSSLPPQSPSDSFFSSNLNPQSPPFAPSTPPKVLRAPPGLSLPLQQQHFQQQQQQHQHQQLPFDNRMGEFLIPPSYGPYDHLLPSAPPPPGLLVSTSVTLPPGSSSPLGFRTSVGSALPDNPFQGEEENDALIEAELQELGGRMIGSILDLDS
ncbi:hypothetical protein ACA910_007748 [Epithemia clementina (nom. ined.)]